MEVLLGDIDSSFLSSLEVLQLFGRHWEGEVKNQPEGSHTLISLVLAFEINEGFLWVFFEKQIQVEVVQLQCPSILHVPQHSRPEFHIEQERVVDHILFEHHQNLQLGTVKTASRQGDLKGKFHVADSNETGTVDLNFVETVDGVHSHLSEFAPYDVLTEGLLGEAHFVDVCELIIELEGLIEERRHDVDGHFLKGTLLGSEEFD